MKSGIQELLFVRYLTSLAVYAPYFCLTLFSFISNLGTQETTSSCKDQDGLFFLSLLVNYNKVTQLGLNLFIIMTLGCTHWIATVFFFLNKLSGNFFLMEAYYRMYHWENFCQALNQKVNQNDSIKIDFLFRGHINECSEYQRPYKWLNLDGSE